MNESIEVMEGTEIGSVEELREFLNDIRSKLAEQGNTAIYAMSAMNFVMNLPDIYNLLDPENKEIARDVWLRIKNAGINVDDPPMLFGDS